jgi:hypothetical protein
MPRQRVKSLAAKSRRLNAISHANLTFRNGEYVHADRRLGQRKTISRDVFVRFLHVWKKLPGAGARRRQSV